MAATTNPHSSPTASGDELHALAVQLYGLISSVHDSLAYNVDARGPALTAIGEDGKRRPVSPAEEEAARPAWQRAPGGGYHVWFPLTLGPASTNPEQTSPGVARAWFERHLIAAGLELEVFPSGRCLRAPCWVGMALLQATRPDDPDSLALVPWPNTTANERA